MEHSLRILRGGSFLSRIISTIVALTVSNLLFYLGDDTLVAIGISHYLLPYLAKAVGGLSGTITEYAGNAATYRYVVKREFGGIKEFVGFYVVAALISILGLLPFIILIEWCKASFLVSSISASTVSWFLGRKHIDAFMRKRLLLTLPRPVGKVGVKAIRKSEVVVKFLLWVVRSR
jgi:hypothetical protein